VLFQSTVTEDFWTGVKSGGELRFNTPGASDEQDLAVEGIRLHVLGDRLGLGGSAGNPVHQLRRSVIPGRPLVRYTAIIFGDKSVLWAWYDTVMSSIKIMRAPIDG
jgi:hypothetical protein